jgi:elongation factor P
MIDTSQFKKGVFIEFDGIPFQIIEFQHVKPGKGNAFVRTRIKNLINNNVIDKTFKSGDRCEEPELETKHMQYLYTDGDGFQFMDLEAYEQISLDQKTVGEKKFYLVENLEIEVLYFKGKPIAIEMPNFVELVVTYTEPGIKGDTVSGGGKPATVSTGLTVTVPYHVNKDDRLKIDTRSGEYVEKIK